MCGEQQRLRKQLSSLLNSFTNGSSVVLYKSDTSTSSNSSCEEDIDVENDDETGYGSADDSASTISGSSLNSVL